MRLRNWPEPKITPEGRREVDPREIVYSARARGHLEDLKRLFHRGGSVSRPTEQELVEELAKLGAFLPGNGGMYISVATAARRALELLPAHASQCAECGVSLGFRADYCNKCVPALPGKTAAEEELCDAVETHGLTSDRVMEAARRLREERKPKPRFVLSGSSVITDTKSGLIFDACNWCATPGRGNVPAEIVIALNAAAERGEL